MVNTAMSKLHPGKNFVKGILTKNRDKTLVNYRYCFYKLAREMKYTTIQIANFTKFDHATILHGVSSIKDLLSVEDEQTIINLNSIYDELKDRYGIDGDFQFNGKEQD